MRSYAVLRVFAFGIVAALVWTACGGVPASGQAQSGGVVRVATDAEPNTFDWQSSTATATRLVAWHVFEGLYAIDQSYAVRPLLAAGAPAVSPDGLHYTIKLRPGLRFHNGQPVTAEDAIASLQRWGKLSGGGQVTFKYITALRAADPQTIEITLSAPFTPLVTNLGDPKQSAVIMPKAIAERAGLKPLSELVGTGPYIFKRWTRGQEIVLARNPAYASRTENWGGLTGRKVAYTDEIDFTPVTDPQVRLAGVSTGQYDFALALPADLYPKVKPNAHLTSDIVKVFSWIGVVFNKAHGLFTDVRLRQAVQYAMKDSDLMAAAAGPKEFWQLDPGLFFPEQRDLHSTAGADVYNHPNLDRARGLLREAGYKGDKVVVMTTKDYTDLYDAAQVLVPELQAAGFTVDLQVYDWATLLTRRAKPELYDIFITGFSPSIDPTGVIFFGPTWPGWYKSAALDRLLGDWSRTPPGTEARKKTLDQIQTLFYSEVPVAKVGNIFGLEVYNNGHLRGYASYFDVRFWNTWVTH